MNSEIDNNMTETVDIEEADSGEIEDCTSENGVENDVAEPTLSKNQLKKLRRKEKWNEVKAQKRKAEKERYKARKKACRERGEELGPTRKQLKHNKMSKSNCNLKVAIDCDFDDYMAEKDIKMLVKQIQFSYSANRRAENPLQFYCCGISGKTKERLESLGDYRGWDIRFRTQNYLEVFDKQSVVYLSSESPNVLETLDDNKVYIIGGLVDHNHHKGLCHKLAEEKGLNHAQLPISDYIDMKTRKVLTINHVFEILLNFTITKDWQKSFYTVLPPRKGAIPKLTDNDKCDNSDSMPAHQSADCELSENEKPENEESEIGDKGKSEVAVSEINDKDKHKDIKSEIVSEDHKNSETNYEEESIIIDTKVQEDESINENKVKSSVKDETESNVKDFDKKINNEELDDNLKKGSSDMSS
ncbi:tRNA methyltransferase 10 [Mactra antiquata]